MDQATSPVINHFIASVLTLVAVFPLVRWQVQHLLKKSEKHEDKINKLELALKDAENNSNKKIIEAFAQSTKEQQATLITVSEQFSNALAQVSASNLENRDHLDKKLVEVHERIDEVMTGQIKLESQVKDQIHQLELTVVSTLKQGKSTVRKDHA